MFFEIGNGRFKSFNVVTQQANASVAISTQQPANFASGMIVVNGEDSAKIGHGTNHIVLLVTNRTFAILRIKNLFILFVSKIKLSLKICANIVKFLFFSVCFEINRMVFLHTQFAMRLKTIRFGRVFEKFINGLHLLASATPFISFCNFWASRSKMRMSANIFVWFSRNCSRRPIISFGNLCFSSTPTVAISVLNLF